MPTLAETRARVETDLDDATLQTIIDAETEALNRHAGGDTETETQFASGLRTIVLKRKPSAITSVKERLTPSADQVTLDTTDWRQVGKYALRRVPGGANSSSFWGAEVVVEYVPEIDVQLRERVLFDLIQMAVEFRAFDRERVGDVEGWQMDFDKRRKSLLAQVTEGRGLFA